MNYKLSTKKPNQIVEIERWIHSDKSVTITKKWKTGHLILTESPLFPEHYSPKVGIDVNHVFEPIHHSFRGSETRYEYLHVNQSEQEFLEKIYSDSMGEGLEQLGWKNTKFQCWFYGELKIDEIFK